MKPQIRPWSSIFLAVRHRASTLFAILGLSAVILDLLSRIALHMARIPAANTLVPLRLLGERLLPGLAALLFWNSEFGVGVGDAILIWAVFWSAGERKRGGRSRKTLTLYALAICYAVPSIYLTAAWIFMGATVPMTNGELDVEFITEGGLRAVGDVFLALSLGTNLLRVRNAGGPSSA